MKSKYILPKQKVMFVKEWLSQKNKANILEKYGDSTFFPMALKIAAKSLTGELESFKGIPQGTDSSFVIGKCMPMEKGLYDI